MSNYVNICFTNDGLYSATLSDQRGGPSRVIDALSYAIELKSRSHGQRGTPLERFEPDVVMVDYLRTTTRSMNPVDRRFRPTPSATSTGASLLTRTWTNNSTAPSAISTNTLSGAAGEYGPDGYSPNSLGPPELTATSREARPHPVSNSARQAMPRCSENACFSPTQPQLPSPSSRFHASATLRERHLRTQNRRELRH